MRNMKFVYKLMTHKFSSFSRIYICPLVSCSSGVFCKYCGRITNIGVVSPTGNLKRTIHVKINVFVYNTSHFFPLIFDCKGTRRFSSHKYKGALATERKPRSAQLTFVFLPPKVLERRHEAASAIRHAPTPHVTAPGRVTPPLCEKGAPGKGRGGTEKKANELSPSLPPPPISPPSSLT